MFSAPLQFPPPFLLLHTDMSVWLGTSPVGSDGFGGVVPRGEFSAHQHARDESCCSGSSCVSAPVVGSECRSDKRQRHCCCLPLKSDSFCSESDPLVQDH